MQKQQSHIHADLLNEVGQKFGTFCDSVGKIDFTQHSDEDFESFYAAAAYGMGKLLKHLNRHLAAKQRQQIQAFIKVHRVVCPPLERLDLSYYEGEKLTELHRLLLIDPRPLREKAKILFK